MWSKNIIFMILKSFIPHNGYVYIYVYIYIDFKISALLAQFLCG